MLDDVYKRGRMMAESRRNHNRVPAGKNRSPTIRIVAGASVLLILAVWALRPSPYARVTNLGSRGSSVIAFGDSLMRSGASAVRISVQLSAMSGVPVVTRAGAATDRVGAGTNRERRPPRESRIVSSFSAAMIFGRHGHPIHEATCGRASTRSRHGRDGHLLGFAPQLTANYEDMYERVGARKVASRRPNLKGILTDPALRIDQSTPTRALRLWPAHDQPLRELLRKADAKRRFERSSPERSNGA